MSFSDLMCLLIYYRLIHNRSFPSLFCLAVLHLPHGWRVVVTSVSHVVPTTLQLLGSSSCVSSSCSSVFVILGRIRSPLVGTCSFSSSLSHVTVLVCLLPFGLLPQGGLWMLLQSFYAILPWLEIAADVHLVQAGCTVGCVVSEYPPGWVRMTGVSKVKAVH